MKKTTLINKYTKRILYVFFLFFLGKNFLFAQKIGINTNAPTNDLHINSTADPIRLVGMQTGSNADSIVTINSTGLLKRRNTNTLFNSFAWRLVGNSGTSAGANFVGTTDAQPLIVKSNNIEGLRVITNGYVGVNTASPTGFLHATSSSAANSVLFERTHSIAATTSVNLRLLGYYAAGTNPINTSGTGISFRMKDNITPETPEAAIRLLHGSAAGKGHLEFITSDDVNGSANVRMHINEGGKVGIGVTNPGKILTIRDNDPSFAPTTAQLLTGYAADPVASTLINSVEFSEINTGTTGMSLDHYDGGAALSGGTSNNRLDVSSIITGTRSAVATFTNNGNVGIGTIAPIGRLHVENIGLNHALYAPIATNYNYFAGKTAFGPYSSNPVGTAIIGPDASTRVHLQEDVTDFTPTIIEGFGSKLKLSNTASTNVIVLGINSRVHIPLTSSQDFTNRLVAGNLDIKHYGTGIIFKTYGAIARAANMGAGRITNAYGVYTDVATYSTGIIDNAFALYCGSSPSPVITSNTINGYGLYIDDLKATNGFGVYQVSADDKNIFMGNTGIGTTTPVYKLDVSASADPIRLVGLQTGAATDDVVTSDATGVLKKQTAANLVGNNAWALDGNNVPAIKKLGTTSNFDLPIITNNTEKMRVLVNGNVGIGTIAPIGRLHVVNTGANHAIYAPIATNYNYFAGKTAFGSYADNPTAAAIIGTNSETYVNLQEDITVFPASAIVVEGISSKLKLSTTATAANFVFGMNSRVHTPTTNTQNFTAALQAANLDFKHYGSGTVTTAMGTIARVANMGTGRIIKAIGINIDVATYSTGQIDTSFGVFIGKTAAATSNLVNAYGICIRDILASNGVGIGQFGANDRNFFIGNLGLGLYNAINKLDIAGGAVIGGTYAGVQTAPTNGLLIEGNVGVGTTSPNTKLDVDGAVAIRSGAVSVTADNQVITVGNRSYIKLTGDAVPSSRTITLSSGLSDGQILIISVIGTGTNGIELADSGNLNLSGLMQLDNGDTIQLIWDGTSWNEITRSSN